MPDTSFISIPKPPSSSLYRKRGVGLFMTLAALMLAVSLALFASAFFYKQLLQKQRSAVEDSLKRLEADFEPSLLVELGRTSSILSSARTLLGNHVSVSRIFQFIEENIFDDVRFSTFSYNVENNMLKMNGQARSYASLAEQAAVFEESKFVENVSLSNLSLASGGDVGFSIAILFKRPIVQYQ